MHQQEKLSVFEQKELYECGDMIFFIHRPDILYEIVGVNPGVNPSPSVSRYLIQQENGAFVLEGDEANRWIAQGNYINERLLVKGLEYSWVSGTNISILDDLGYVIKVIKKEIYGNQI